jgi:hypothetical protein
VSDVPLVKISPVLITAASVVCDCVVKLGENENTTLPEESVKVKFPLTVTLVDCVAISF